MKRFGSLALVFCIGLLAASFAFAGNGHGGPQGSTSTSASPGKSGDHGGKAKCRPLNLKGTVTGATVALNVTKASGPKGKQLEGTTANLTVSGKVSVQAWDCSAAGSSAAPQLKLRQLHVGGSPQAQTTTTP